MTESEKMGDTPCKPTCSTPALCEYLGCMDMHRLVRVDLTAIAIAPKETPK